MSWATVAVAAGTAVAGYASSKGNKVKAGEQDIGQSILQYISGYREGLPSILSLERNNRGKFQKLNLQEIGGFLQGAGNNGIFGLSRISGREASDQLQGARSRDIRGMRGDTGITRSLLDRLNPEGSAQVDALTAQATRAQEASLGLSGQEQRSAEQFAREQGLASGRIGDNSTIANALYGREDMLARKRAEASLASQNALQASSGFYTQPGLSLLTQMPQSYQAGQGLLGLGLSSLGSATPQLVNPDAGINIGAANRQNQLAAAGINAQTSAANQANWANLLGSAYGSYMQYGQG